MDGTRTPYVRDAAPADLPAMRRTLARAFVTEPFVSWFTKRDDRQLERLEGFFDLYLRLTLPHGLVHVMSDYSGAALWVPPERWQLGPLAQLRLLPATLRVTGVRAFFSRLSAVNYAERFHPTEPHYYLLAVGVDPGHQRRGIGSALLQPGLRRCDETATPAYLETPSEPYLPFYERHGFQVQRTIQLPHGGPQVWLMWREPAAL